MDSFLLSLYHLQLINMTNYSQNCENCCNSKLTLWDDNKIVGPHGNLITPNQLIFLFSHLTNMQTREMTSLISFSFPFSHIPHKKSKHIIIAIMVSSTKTFKKFDSLSTMDLLKIVKRNKKKSLPITCNPMQWSMRIF